MNIMIVMKRKMMMRRLKEEQRVVKAKIMKTGTSCKLC